MFFKVRQVSTYENIPDEYDMRGCLYSAQDTTFILIILEIANPGQQLRSRDLLSNSIANHNRE
jgi:hypothetical protein